MWSKPLCDFFRTFFGKLSLFKKIMMVFGVFKSAFTTAKSYACYHKVLTCEFCHVFRTIIFQTGDLFLNVEGPLILEMTS